MAKKLLKEDSIPWIKREVSKMIEGKDCVSWGKIKLPAIHLVGKFPKGTAADQRYVWINGEQIFLDEEFDYQSDEKWEYFSEPTPSWFKASFGKSLSELTKLRSLKDFSSLKYMFYQYLNLKNFDFPNQDTSKCTDMNAMFYGCKNITSINLSNWNVENVTDMGSLFSACEKLKDVNIDNWDTKNVKDFHSMFDGCKALSTIDCKTLNTSNATTLSYMFSNCWDIEELDLLGWNTSKVTTMSQMFNQCSRLKTIHGLSELQTENLQYSSSMFSSCSSLESIDLSKWDVRNLKEAGSMFSNCSRLTTVDLSNWNIGNMTYIRNMFYYCNNLITVNLSNWDFDNKLSDYDGMFSNCTSLTTIIGPIHNLSLSFNLKDSPLTVDSAMVFINGIIEKWKNQTLTFSSTTYDSLTPEQIAVGTAKGWSIVKS